MTDSKTTQLHRASPPAAPASPLDDDDLLREILSRLPPQPSSLPRAYLVSRRWGDLVSDPHFLRRFCAHHRKAPLLGLFQKSGREASFVPFLGPPDRIPPGRFSLRIDGVDAVEWRLLGCRHGRILVINRTGVWNLDLVVFSPVTGGRCRIALPPDYDKKILNAQVHGAVLCAAGDDRGHVHGCCHSSPFKVVLVRSPRRGEARAVAHVYSSHTGIWGNPIFTAEQCIGRVGTLIPSTLAGNALYWWLHGSEDSMLEFHLDRETLAVIERPLVMNYYHGRSIQTEDGGLGFAMLSYPYIQMWDRDLNCHGDAVWMLRKTVHLQEMLEPGSGMDGGWADILGYAEDADTIFLLVDNDAYMVQLGTMRSTKLPGTYMGSMYHPFTNFYAPGAFRSPPSTATDIEPPKQ